MTQKQLGYSSVVVGFGMVLVTLAGDFNSLNSFHDIDPKWIGGVMLHIGGLCLAGIGGNLVPNLFKKYVDIVSQAKLAELNK